MARPLRVQLPGAIYHVTSRGTGPCVIFHDDRDRTAFVGRLRSVVDRCRWNCHAYCLMATHYHLLLETPVANLAIGMQLLNGSYAQGFNRRHGRVGALLQGRYHSKLIETERHFHQATLYIALNPVRAGLCAEPEDWPWSGSLLRGLTPVTEPDPVGEAPVSRESRRSAG